MFRNREREIGAHEKEQFREILITQSITICDIIIRLMSTITRISTYV